MTSLTTHRHNIMMDDNLPLETKEVMLKFLEEKLGYPAPVELLAEMRDQADKDSPLYEGVEDVRDFDFLEVWHKGAGHSSKKQGWKGITFHHTAGTILGTIDHLTKRTKRASYHCMIAEDGNRHRFVDDALRAYHAGYGVIHGSNPNHVNLAISYNGDTQTGKFRETKDLTDLEIASTVEFIRPRWHKFKDFWKYTGDHRQCDPERRNDLNPLALEQLLEAIEAEFGR